MSMNLAHFPISGQKVNPSRDDYAREAFLLRVEGRFADAQEFEDTWRRLGWTPDALEKMRTAA